MIIYKITNKLNGKCYIGQTTKSVKDRWSAHCKSKKYFLSNSIKKYGKENFSIEEIAKYSNMEDLNNAEEYFIDFYNCIVPNGYNFAPGGRGHNSHIAWNKGKPMLPHVKEALKKANEKNTRNKGKIFSLEWKRNLSLSHKGKIHNGTFKKGHKNSKKAELKRVRALGLHRHPEEVKKKMSESQKKVVHTPEWNKKISIEKKGKKLSLNHRRNISLAKKNMPWSEKQKKSYETRYNRVSK